MHVQLKRYEVTILERSTTFADTNATLNVMGLTSWWAILCSFRHRCIASTVAAMLDGSCPDTGKQLHFLVVKSQKPPCLHWPKQSMSRVHASEFDTPAN
ncbi:hypothetical protein GOBAR_DD23227 [Gossypium barbadense]|nr:hypothetical protein GOBAR_DD23227 [Gossypium barbadense]